MATSSLDIHWQRRYYLRRKKVVRKNRRKKPQASQVKSIAVKRKGGPAKTIKIGEKVEEKKEVLKKEKKLR